MRSRRGFTIMASATVGIAMLAVSTGTGLPGRRSEAARGPERPTFERAAALAPIGPLSLGSSVAQDRLEGDARQAAGAAVVREKARRAAAAVAAEQARRVAAEQARRVAAERRARAARASRDAVRARPPAAAAPAAPDDVWAKLRRCEAGGDYTRNSGNGYYGAYQFAAATWRSLGYPGLPHQAPPAVQDEAARKLQRRSGWGQWPACSRRIGVR